MKKIAPLTLSLLIVFVGPVRADETIGYGDPVRR